MLTQNLHLKNSNNTSKRLNKMQIFGNYVLISNRVHVLQRLAIFTSPTPENTYMQIAEYIEIHLEEWSPCFIWIIRNWTTLEQAKNCRLLIEIHFGRMVTRFHLDNSKLHLQTKDSVRWQSKVIHIYKNIQRLAIITSPTSEYYVRFIPQYGNHVL